MKFRQVVTLAAGVSLAALLLGGASCPWPPVPPEPTPTPVCQPEGGQFTDCWHRPPETGVWTYRCAAPWLPDGYVDVADPKDCPTPPGPPPTTLPPPPTPPPPGSCPGDPMPMDKRVIFAKVVRPDAGTGLPGKVDSTPRINDQAYCDRVTNEPQPVFSCKANPEGSGYTACEDEFLGQHCPAWYYTVLEPGVPGQPGPGSVWHRCLPVGAPVSCDHFDDWNEQGPYLGRCEKNPEGSPITGFAMVAHGPDGWKPDGSGRRAWVRACSADGVCSNVLEIAH